MEAKEKAAVLQEAIEIALLAGEKLKSFWGKLAKVESKGYFWDLVTEADVASEQVILQEIKARFPSHDILSEEAGLKVQTDHSFQWMVDPLDGTTNFTHQFPMVSISIGLLHQGIPLIGVVYNPILNELFEGAIGVHARLNGQPLSVSKADSIDRSLLATGFAYDRKETKDNNFAEFFHLTNMTQGVRRLGSAALDLAFVAAGRLDGYWERGLKPWDMAAGIVLVRQAGGEVTSYEGGQIDLASGRILATNGRIHRLLSDELQAAKSSIPS